MNNNRLNTFFNVSKAFQGEYSSDFMNNDIRDFMSANMTANNSPFVLKSRYEYERDFNRERNGSRKFVKSNTLVGHQWSNIISKLKKGVIDELKYLEYVFVTNWNIGSKVEPKLYEVRQKCKSGEWNEIPFADYILTMTNNRGESAEGQYAEFFDKFEKFQRLHNLHESINEPMLVAYYPSLDYMRKGREVRTKFGKYLTQFANEFGIDATIIKELSEIHTARILARKGWQVNFIEHDDEQGWLDVYGSGVGSCMQGKSCVRVYAHEKSVLRLAHIKTNEGMTLARCIVREDNKEWIRTYPDHNGYAEGRHLKQSLETMGYTFGTMNGVLIKAISHPDYEGHYVMPYIDYGNNGGQSADLITIDHKQYLEITDGGDYVCNNTNGTTYDPESDEEYGNYCDDCDSHYNDDEGNYSDYHGVWICNSCQDSYEWAVTNHNDSDLVHESDVIYCETDSEYYLNDTNLLITYDIRQCPSDLNYYHVDEMKLTSIGWVYEDNATIVDYLHQNEFDCVVNDDVHELSNGKKCHVDDAEELQAEIDFNESQEVLNLACEVSYE